MKDNHRPEDYALFHCRLAKVDILLEVNELEYMVHEVWSAMDVVNEVGDQEAVDMLKMLTHKCRSNSVLGTVTPLLMGMRALLSDQVSDRDRRDLWLNAAFYVAPNDDDLLTLAKKRGWSTTIS